MRINSFTFTVSIVYACNNSNHPRPSRTNPTNPIPGIVDAVYTWLVLPVSKAFYRAARLVSHAIHTIILRPALAVARWWWGLVVPPIASALRWLWGGICAVPGWAWYVIVSHTHEIHVLKDG